MDEKTISELINIIQYQQEEIGRLREEAARTADAMRQLTGIVGQMFDKVSLLPDYEKWFRAFIKRVEDRVHNLPYEMSDSRYSLLGFYPYIMSRSETRRKVMEGASIGRYGDGEFSIIAGSARWRFQDNDEMLAERLREILTVNDPGFLVGLHDCYGAMVDPFLQSERMADAVRSYMTDEMRKMQTGLLNKDRVYATAYISGIQSANDVKELQAIWRDRDCVFVEGHQTRMGVGNDLFDCCESIERVLCPAENAFAKYDEILNEVRGSSRNKLILIALGPTATVLAYDLYCEGYHAVDIGHADLQYEYLLRNVPYGTTIPGKYSAINETQEGIPIAEINDPVYESQVIACIQ